MSRQIVNYHNSSVYFSTNIDLIIRKKIQCCINIPYIFGFNKYLGLLALFVRSNRTQMGYILYRVQAKIQRWSFKFLSMARKEVCLKLMACVMPNFTMQCFFFPIGLWDDSENALQNF